MFLMRSSFRPVGDFQMAKRDGSVHLHALRYAVPFLVGADVITHQASPCKKKLDIFRAY